MTFDFTSAGRALAAFGVLAAAGAAFWPAGPAYNMAKFGAAVVGAAAILVGAAVVTIGG